MLTQDTVKGRYSKVSLVQQGQAAQVLSYREIPLLITLCHGKYKFFQVLWWAFGVFVWFLGGFLVFSFCCFLFWFFLLCVLLLKAFPEMWNPSVLCGQVICNPK